MVKKIVWVSSYLPRSCGIAYYSADYISALRQYAGENRKNISVKIVAHTDAKEADYAVIDNVRDKNWFMKVLKVVRKERPDVVHIQHEFGLYESFRDCNQGVVKLIKLIKKENIPVVMTYHSVYRKLIPPHANFVSQTLKELDAGIFHCEYQREALKSNIGWKPENVHILPHGSKENLGLKKEEVRKGHGYSESELIVGSAGLASRRKGYRKLVKQWPKVVEKFPNALLSLEIKPESVEETKNYVNKVLREILKSPVMKNIEFVVRDYDACDFYKRLASFDVLVLAYKSESQSGVLAHGFSVGAPAVVTDIEGLGAEIRNSKSGIAVKNRSEYYKAIIKMLSSKKLRDKYSRNALKYVKEKSGWSIIAKKTFGIYEGVW